MAKSNRPPQKGSFLLSEPFLADKNFKRTVVLLTEHNEDGSIGFILNKPIRFRLNEIVEGFPDFNVPVYMGGPVQQDSLHFIHRVEALAEEGDEVVPGIYWGGNFEKLKMMIEGQQVTEQDIRFFVGYSGWGPEQLEEEMESNSWIVSPVRARFTFSDQTDSLWGDILRTMGGKYKAFSNYPEDPSLN